MIGSTSEPIRPIDSIKLFGINLIKSRRQTLLRMWNELTINLPKKFNISTNFFKDRYTYHGEAILDFLSTCVLLWQPSKDLSELIFKMKTDVIRKFNRNNTDNGWEGGLHLNAI